MFNKLYSDTSKEGYLYGIDLLRVLAIVLIFIFHLDANALTGGFLGVDLFFVISGYLVTSSMIRSDERGPADFFRRLGRRLKRLLPSIVFMVVLVFILLALVDKTLLAKVYKDGIIGAIFGGNWWFIFKEVDYFDSFAASPFNHLWYLGVQEQALVIVGIIFFVLRSKVDNKRMRKAYFERSLLVAILVSLIASWIFFDVHNISRVYYGTDTRMAEVFVGALLASLAPARALAKKTPDEYSKSLAVLSVLGLVAFVLASVLVSQYSFFLYRGGFILFALLAGILIILVGKRGNALEAIAKSKPIRVLADLSFPIYLWHYPILVISKMPYEVDGPKASFSLVRIGIIFLAGLGAMVLVEKRKKVLEVLDKGQARKAFLKMALCLVLALSLTGAFKVSAQTYIKKQEAEEERLKEEKKKEAEERKKKAEEEKKKKAEEEAQQKPIYKATGYDQVIIIGDSIGMQLEAPMKEIFPSIIVDGEVSRQLYNSAGLASWYASEFDSKGTAIVFELGTNDMFDEEDLDNLVAGFEDSQLFLINTRSPLSWEPYANELLASYANKYDHIELIDWAQVSDGHPEYFKDDGVHLLEDGVDAYVNMIIDSLSASSQGKTGDRSQGPGDEKSSEDTSEDKAGEESSEASES